MWGDLWELTDPRREVFRLAKEREGEDSAIESLEEPVYDDRIFRAIVYTEYRPIKPLIAKYPDVIPTMANQIVDREYLISHKSLVTSFLTSIRLQVFTTCDTRHSSFIAISARATS